MVTFTAEGLVFLCLSKEDALVALYQTVTEIGQGTAFDADGMHLGHFVGDGTEGWNGAEGYTAEVHVETGNDDAYAAIGQFVTDAHQTFVEKLGFVDANHVDVGGEQENACRRVDGGGKNGVLVVADNFFIGIARIDAWLENLNALPGKLGPFQTADELLGLA